MKRSNPFLLFTLGVLFIGLTSCEKEKTISEAELPSAIKSYLAIHFSNCGVTKAVREKKKKKISHDINLSCGVNIEFNGQDGTVKNFVFLNNLG